MILSAATLMSLTEGFVYWTANLYINSPRLCFLAVEQSTVVQSQNLLSDGSEVMGTNQCDLEETPARYTEGNS